MPIVLLKLTYYSQIMLKNNYFLVHRQKHDEKFSPMYVHALNGGPHIIIIIMFSHGKGFEASLLFSLV